ncbi:hypothetical protein IWW52_001415 [Coemansia sp. RSA 2704]|nr:hypothetical protein IWW52_001415 [Coemansia sp. RSA 2704]
MGEHVERMGGDAYAKVYALYNIAFSVSSIIVPTIMPPIMNAVGFAATMGIIASILVVGAIILAIQPTLMLSKHVWFNLLNTIIGSGVLCLPYALHNAGFVFGLLMLGVIAVLSQFSLYVLVLTGKRTGTSHFSSVTEAALGNFGYHLLNYSMIIDMVGTVTLYLMIVGDMVTALANIYLPVACTRSSVIMIVSFLVILLLLFFRNTGPLARFSVVQFLFAILLIFSTPLSFYLIRDTVTEMLKIDPERHQVSRIWESLSFGMWVMVLGTYNISRDK